RRGAVDSAGAGVVRHPDPIIRRALAYDRARARVRRRVALLRAYLDGRPRPGELERLEDLLGEADATRTALE
ncbi:MAG: hypothetical protein NTV85_32875, partial [Hyphomicrobiales bacterium]|nr:hypothetical protein [Hyphomicrobiales bacterium]